MLLDQLHLQSSCKNIVQVFLPRKDVVCREVVARQLEHVKQPHL